MKQQSLQEQIDSLERSREEHAGEHRQITERFDRFEQKLDELKVYLTGNGRITIGMSEGRLRFAGSLSWRKWMTAVVLITGAVLAQQAGWLAEFVSILLRAK